MDVRFVDSDIESFIRGLDASTVAKVLRTIDLLEQFGNHLGLPHSKSLGDGYFELRIRGHLDVRFVYVFHRKCIVLLHGFVKKSRKIPIRALHKAHQKRALLD